MPKLTENYNNSIHSSTFHKPNKAKYHSKFIADHLYNSATYKLQSLPSLPPLSLGDSVRISLQTTAEYRKDLFRKKYLVQWSKEIYCIATIVQASTLSSEKYTLFDSKENYTNKRYNRYQLQHIDKSKLILNETNRPKFDPTFPYRTPPVLSTNNNNRRSIIRQPVTRLQAQQVEQIQNTILTAEKIADLYRQNVLHNFTIDTSIILPTTPTITDTNIITTTNTNTNTNINTSTNINNFLPNNNLLLSPSQIAEINNKYGLHNFIINVGIRLTKK